MKTSKSLRGLILITSISLALFSCNNEEDGNLGDILLKNKWVMYEVELNQYGNSELQYRKDDQCLYFLSESEGVQITDTRILDTEGENTRDRDYSFFTYNINGNNVSLKYSKSGNPILTYKNGLLESASIQYRPVSLNSDDRKFIIELQDEHKYRGNYDINYIISFDHDALAKSVYSHNKYYHTIPLTFSVPANTLKRGITEFGVAISAEGATIENKVKRFHGDAYVMSERVNGLVMKCFSATVGDNNEHVWQTPLSITSSSNSFTLKYTFLITTKDDGRIYGDYLKSEKFEMQGSNEDEDNGNNSGSGVIAGHQYVDLGLSVKWATCNVNSSEPESYGTYYAWGETNAKSNYSWSNYTYCDGTQNSCQNIGYNISGTEYDIAHVKWGSTWRLPTSQEVQELVKKCKSEMTFVNATYGCKFTGPNGKSIFLPAAGYHYDNNTNFVASGGYYWSGTWDDTAWWATMLHFSSQQGAHLSRQVRRCGLSVRPVSE